MKQKVFSILLIVVALLALGGIVLIGCTAETENIASSVAAIIVLAAVSVIAVILLLRTLRSKGRYDALTGLGDERIVREHFDRSRLDYQKYVCLVYFSCDAGKKALDAEDTEHCNAMQKKVAELLSAQCGEEDCLGRIGEGVFLASLCCVDVLNAQSRVVRMTEELNRAMAEGDNPVVFRAGVCLSESNTTFDTAFAHASLACRYAAENDVNTCICTKDLLLKDAARNRLRERLSRAIDGNQFEPYVQFVYDVRQQQFAGAEVLSRWNDPEEGLRMPAYYINDMRVTGVIEKFDMYMLDRTCRILQQWKDTEFGRLLLSCNITRVTISSENFLKSFLEITGRYDFDHTRLILEITEDALIDDQTLAYQNIVACKEGGFRVAIDDFGAGHSSLRDINDYPIDQIKVDRQFVNTTDRGDALLRELIRLAHNLHIEVVCEGVENKQQESTAVRSGCDYVQGYLHSYVFPVEEARKHYLSTLSETDTEN